jgi:SAM-dependent methyltransferase
MNKIKLFFKRGFHFVVNFFIELLRIITFTKKNSFRYLKIKNFIVSLFTILVRPIAKKFYPLDWEKTSSAVEKKYTNLAGSDNHFKMLDGKKGNKLNWQVVSDFIKEKEKIEKLCYVDNEVSTISPNGYSDKRAKEFNDIISKFEFKNILEVGAGELSFLSGVVEKFGNKVDYYALDLSLNRLYQGRKEFNKKFNIDVKLCKVNAIKLPYPNNYFDLVYSSHCLEHMPYDYQAAIKEMVRVAKNVVILIEPTYELGTFSQKLRMRAHDYVRGIPGFIKKLKNAKLINFKIIGTGSLFNRSAIHIIKVKKNKIKPLNKKDFQYVCPLCKKKLIQHKYYYKCKGCEKIYLVFDGIPIFDFNYSFFIGKKYN